MPSGPERARPHNLLPDNQITPGIARKRLELAVKRGELTRPAVCQRCHLAPGLDRRGTPQIRGYQAGNYLNPYEVEWLCCSCLNKATRRKVPS
jgi:hypothetical protein